MLWRVILRVDGLTRGISRDIVGRGVMLPSGERRRDQYVMFERLPFDEDQTHEFKALHMHIDKPVRRVIDYAAKYVNAFLNTNGGTLYCGVDVRAKAG